MVYMWISNGLYFIDDITKGIYLFNGQLNNLSDKFGFILG